MKSGETGRELFGLVVAQIKEALIAAGIESRENVERAWFVIRGAEHQEHE
jgi:hypothetical protein